MCRGLDHSLTYMAAHLLQRTVHYRIRLHIALEPNTVSAAEPHVNHFCLHLCSPFPRWHVFEFRLICKSNVSTAFFPTLNTLWPCATTNNNCSKELCTKQIHCCLWTLFIDQISTVSCRNCLIQNIISVGKTRVWLFLFETHGAVMQSITWSQTWTQKTKQW